MNDNLYEHHATCRSLLLSQLRLRQKLTAQCQSRASRGRNTQDHLICEGRYILHLCLLNRHANWITRTFASADVILVIVGKEKVEFGVHKKVLVRSSPFFEACFRADIKEAQENTVTLCEDDPEAFEIVVDWMYGGRSLQGHLYDTLVISYLLADKLLMRDLQNAIIDLFRTFAAPEPCKAAWIWDTVAEDCPFRELVLNRLHFSIATMPHLYWMPSDGSTPYDYAQQLQEILKGGGSLATAFFWRFFERGNIDLVPPSTLTGCVFHLHDDGKKCN